MKDRRTKEKICFNCGGELTEAFSETTLAVFIECKPCGLIVGSYVRKRRDDPDDEQI